MLFSDLPVVSDLFSKVVNICRPQVDDEVSHVQDVGEDINGQVCRSQYLCVDAYLDWDDDSGVQRCSDDQIVPRSPPGPLDADLPAWIDLALLVAGRFKRFEFLPEYLRFLVFIVRIFATVVVAIIFVVVEKLL